MIGICLRTLKRWRKAFLGNGDSKVRRKGPPRDRSPAVRGRAPADLADLQPAGVRLAAAGTDRAGPGGSGAVYRFVVQLLSGPAPGGAVPRRGRARLQEPRSVPRLRADGMNQVWSWGISFLPTTVQGVALPGGRCLEPQSGGLGCGRGRIGPDRSGSGAAGLPQGALPPPQRPWQPPVPAAAIDPPCRQWQRHALGDAGITARGDRRAEILFPAKGLQREPVLGIPVPYGQIPPRLPQPAILHQRGCLSMGFFFCGLVQPPAPPQRHQIRDAPPASQGKSHGHLPAASRGLRGRPRCKSNALERCHPLLESTGRSVDQQTNRGAKTEPGVTINPGRLNGSQGVTSFLKVIANEEERLMPK